MIKAIVLDVDGVLVEPMVFASVLESEYGLKREKTEPFFHGPFQRFLLGEGDLRNTLPEVLAEWNVSLAVEEFMRTWFEADSRVNGQMLQFAGAMRERGLRCYIASTQERHRATYLETLPVFSGLFDACFFSCRLRCQKPEKQFFDRIVSETAEAADDLLFFDDIEANVVGARSAGWNAEVYKWGMDLSDTLNKYDIRYHGA
jgi:putative hydrolase of the HAD superfamily